MKEKYVEKETNVLVCLSQGEKRFKELKDSTQFNDVTLTRKLKKLEKIKYISHDHLKKTYKLTSKGLAALKNELDTETRGCIFASHVFADIDFIMFSPLEKDKLDDKRISEISKKLSEAIIFIALKWIEDKQNVDVLKFLNNLPRLLATRMERYGYIEQFENLDYGKLEEYYKDAQIITPERYEKTINFLEEIYDSDFVESI